MLQRYDISMDLETNRLCIEEFIVLDRISRSFKGFDTVTENYSLIQKLTYDRNAIRSVMNEGKGAMISAIRSNNFFPIHSCMDIIVERVIELFENNSNTSSEVFFDDHDQFANSGK